MLTRRLFAKRAPVAAAVLPSALHQTASIGPTPAMGMPPMGSSTGSGASDDRKWSLFNALRRPHTEARWQREQQIHLLGGLDPDLFACRSMPVTQKVRIQAERNRVRERENNSLMKLLADKVGVQWND